jgi:hypothetical protein
VGRASFCMKGMYEGSFCFFTLLGTIPAKLYHLSSHHIGGRWGRTSNHSEVLSRPRAGSFVSFLVRTGFETTQRLMIPHGNDGMLETCMRNLHPLHFSMVRPGITHQPHLPLSLPLIPSRFHPGPFPAFSGGHWLLPP